LRLNPEVVTSTAKAKMAPTTNRKILTPRLKAARLLQDASTDFGRFQPGEVLVARATAPAWTPLFARAVAVVTDGGTLAAHASLVAREYGIPAVVATGDATSRLSDGQLVTVDGGAGTVHLHD
jgi:phosphoenolpyruvate synthase/pyruvate phosphate dikinase